MRLFLYFKVKFFEWIEQRKVEKRFYHNEHFKKCDQALLQAYRRENPYKISKDFLVNQKAPDVYAYGETPLTTMDNIVRECELTQSDLVIEMGAGRGRASLFLAEYIGCKVIAYEQIPAFAEKFSLSPNLKIIAEDMFAADFSKATAIYLYGTMLSDDDILKLCNAFPKNVKIITVSYPLSDYSDNYVIKKTFKGKFPWGKTEVYWNERIS